MITSSPSSRKRRVSPEASVTGARAARAGARQGPHASAVRRANVAPRPVVKEAEASNVLLGLADRDRRAARIARPDEDAELELIIEIARWPEARLGLRAWLALAARPLNGRSRGHDCGAAAMIADRHVLVVGKQRTVGPQHAARVGCMVNAGEEIGVVAD